MPFLRSLLSTLTLSLLHCSVQCIRLEKPFQSPIWHASFCFGVQVLFKRGKYTTIFSYCLGKKKKCVFLNKPIK